MTLTRLIGDIHGQFNDYKTYVIQDFKGPTIQVGDFGIGFGSSQWHDTVNQYHADGTHRFIRGNHDHPSKCKQDMVGYIPDGTVENDVMFIGGAWSIDNPNAPPGWYKRTKGFDWWPDEECSNEEFNQFFETYIVTKPRVMITHTCPTSIAHEMFWETGLLRGPEYPTITESWFDAMWKAHQPEEWYFGHWHYNLVHRKGNTKFRCIDINDYVDVEL